MTLSSYQTPAEMEVQEWALCWWSGGPWDSTWGEGEGEGKEKGEGGRKRKRGKGNEQEKDKYKNKGKARKIKRRIKQSRLITPPASRK